MRNASTVTFVAAVAWTNAMLSVTRIGSALRMCGAVLISSFCNPTNIYFMETPRHTRSRGFMRDADSRSQTQTYLSSTWLSLYFLRFLGDKKHSTCRVMHSPPQGVEPYTAQVGRRRIQTNQTNQ
ncbi:hypothetical protein JB92DRAFT_2981111 [Gautieria morchelliformis]|nr:hypothetical protein JB92DRAFT_2981111 [Gautieria morchelliformis]